MKLLKVVGIAFSIHYLVIGVLSSFTINGIDTYRSILFVVLTFFIPLPISLVGVWRPKNAGVALLLCAAVCGVTLYVSYGAKDAATALSKGYYIPHLVLGVAYILAARQAEANSRVGSG